MKEERLLSFREVMSEEAMIKLRYQERVGVNCVVREGQRAAARDSSLFKDFRGKHAIFEEVNGKHGRKSKEQSMKRS